MQNEVPLPAESSKSKKLNITQIFDTYLNEASGDEGDLKDSLELLIKNNKLESEKFTTNKKSALLEEDLRKIKEHYVSFGINDSDTSKSIKESINMTLQCYKKYFLTKFSNDGNPENCDPDVKNILLNFNDTSGDVNDNNPNLLKSLSVADRDKQALEQLAKVLNNYLARLVIKTESKINNNDLEDQKDNINDIKNILSVFPGGINQQGLNQVQFACIDGTTERVKDAIFVLKKLSPEVDSIKSVIAIFSAQLASKVKKNVQIHIRPSIEESLRINNSIGTTDPGFTKPQKYIPLRIILDFGYNLSNQVKKQIESPITQLIADYQSLRGEESKKIHFEEIDKFIKAAKGLGFDITLNDISTKNYKGEENYEFEGYNISASYLILPDALEKKYSTTIPTQRFKKELSRIEIQEYNYLEHLIDPKNLFKDNSKSGDESSKLDYGKINNLVDLFTAKGSSALDEETRNTQKSKMLAGLVTLRNILYGYKTSDNSYSYFRKFDKKFKESNRESFEDFFYINTNGSLEVKDGFMHEKPILDSIASKIKSKKQLLSINFNEPSRNLDGTASKSLNELLEKLFLIEEDENKIKELLTIIPDILEIKNGSGENLAKILYKFSEEALQIVLDSMPELLDKITEKNNESHTLLQIITLEDNKELLLNILKKYQEIHQDETDKDGKEALGKMIFKQKLLPYIINENNADLLKAIIPILSINNLNLSLPNGFTLLFMACKNGYTKCAQLLIDAGFKVDQVYAERLNPLHIAAEKDYAKIVEILLENGANIEANEEDRKSALHIAAQNGCFKVVKVLLEKGANSEAVDEDGKTALHHAAEYGSSKIVEVLLEKGAKIEAFDNEGMTALHIAAQDGCVQVVKVLLEKGANIEATDEDGKTALHIAAQNGCVQVVKVLLEKGANIEVIDEDGKTALHLAAEYNKSEVVEVLLEKGANIEATDEDGKTALHLAAEYNNGEVVKILLENTADIESIDEDGKTALQLAVEYNNSEVVKILLENTANIEAIDEDGKTALQLAAQNGSIQVVKVQEESSTLDPSTTLSPRCNEAQRSKRKREGSPDFGTGGYGGFASAGGIGRESRR